MFVLDCLRESLLSEIQRWIVSLVTLCKERYRREMDFLYLTFGDFSRRLSRPIRDLDDIRFVMTALTEIRESEVNLELRLIPVEVSYIIFGCLTAAHYNAKQNHS